jgi:hypothetical protein
MAPSSRRFCRAVIVVLVAVAFLTFGARSAHANLPAPFITTVAGNGTDNGVVCPGQTDSAGDGCPALVASLDSPLGVAVDSAGNLYICPGDGFSYIQKVTAATGVITIYAGSVDSQGYSGDNGPATSALLLAPAGVAVDSAGNLFIADTGNIRIRQVTTPIIHIIHLVISYHLPFGIQAILKAPLTAAENTSSNSASCRDLTLFTREVEWVRDVRGLTSDQAAQLISETNRVKASESCPGSLVP